MLSVVKRIENRVSTFMSVKRMIDMEYAVVRRKSIRAKQICMIRLEGIRREFSGKIKKALGENDGEALVKYLLKIILSLDENTEDGVVQGLIEVLRTPDEKIVVLALMSFKILINLQSHRETILSALSELWTSSDVFKLQILTVLLFASPDAIHHFLHCKMALLIFQVDSGTSFEYLQTLSYFIVHLAKNIQTADVPILIHLDFFVVLEITLKVSDWQINYNGLSSIYSLLNSKNYSVVFPHMNKSLIKTFESNDYESLRSCASFLEKYFN